MYHNIKQRSVAHIDSKLYSGHYYDYMLYKGETVHQSSSDIEGMAIADFSGLDIINGKLYSSIYWSGATNGGVLMEDIGLTGVDNGFITFDKTRISNEEFLDLYFNSTYEIESGDTRLFLSPVTGNTQLYAYPAEMVSENGDKYISCKGGFYQGFFKLDGFDYQNLPSDINDEIVYHFDLRPRSDYEQESGTVNTLHPDNEGIFFFMGVRAENKFWPFYNEGMDESMKRPDFESGTCDVVNSEYLVKEPEDEPYFAFGDDYIIPFKSEEDNVFTESKRNGISVKVSDFLNEYDFFPMAACECASCKKKHKEEIPEQENKCTANGKAIDDEYMEFTSIDDVELTTSDGYEFNKRGYYEIESDNKYLMFDRTPDGLTTHTWTEGTTVTLVGRKNIPDTNYFILMNRTPTGYTAHNIDSYNEANGKDYNIYKDIRDNVIAFRITPEGAIGYRFGALDCSDENENRYSVIEEYSKDGIVKMDEWNSINIRFAVISPSKDKCDNKRRKMRIMFYVNGFLVFISKEMDTLHFKALDDIYQKQEGVPYNISLGGGSIGLMETILPNYYKTPEYILPIERDFCGSFIGDIKSFTIYKGFINYSAIKNYLS